MNAIVLPGALALVLAAMTATSAQAQPNVEGLLVRVGERVAEFYKRQRHRERSVGTTDGGSGGQRRLTKAQRAGGSSAAASSSAESE